MPIRCEPAIARAPLGPILAASIVLEPATASTPLRAILAMPTRCEPAIARTPLRPILATSIRCEPAIARTPLWPAGVMSVRRERAGRVALRTGAALAVHGSAAPTSRRPAITGREAVAGCGRLPALTWAPGSRAGPFFAAPRFGPVVGPTVGAARLSVAPPGARPGALRIRGDSPGRRLLARPRVADPTLARVSPVHRDRTTWRGDGPAWVVAGRQPRVLRPGIRGGTPSPRVGGGLAAGGTRSAAPTAPV